MCIVLEHQTYLAMERIVFKPAARPRDERDGRDGRPRQGPRNTTLGWPASRELIFDEAIRTHRDSWVPPYYKGRLEKVG